MRGRSNHRGQLVLTAAGAVAVAVLLLALAYLQLGYTGDVETEAAYDAPVADAERVLDRAVADARDGVPEQYAWDRRRDAVRTVRDRLRPRFDGLRTSRVERGTVYAVAYNDSAATTWAAANCPRGPDRRFGPCETVGGVVLQERAGRTHVLAIAVDLTVTTDRGRITVTTVVRGRG